MPGREKFEANQYYHIYNRGLRKQTLFHAEGDFKRFMIYIDKYIEKCKESFDILAYCILPNHFHFVFHNKSSGYKISYFIGNICAAYTRYYQSKYGIDRGKIYFESRFKCKIIDDSEYLQKCIYYVENNPIRHGMVDDREYWKFRSASYIGNYHPGDKKQLAKIEAELE